MIEVLDSISRIILTAKFLNCIELNVCYLSVISPVFFYNSLFIIGLGNCQGRVFSSLAVKIGSSHTPEDEITRPN